MPSDTAPAPLLVDARELARLLGIGLRTLRSHDSAGRLPRPVRIGGSVRWRVAEIRLWLDAGAPDRETWERIRSASTKPPAR
jgi:predicted DNA-binding transcriptional regulator AlpA